MPHGATQLGDLGVSSMAYKLQLGGLPVVTSGRVEDVPISGAMWEVQVVG